MSMETEKHIGTVLNQLQQEAKIPQLSIEKVLDSYSHIDLTEDEISEAMVWAKRRKEAILENVRIREIEANNRKILTNTQWSYSQTDSFMKYRANTLFEGKFMIDDSNSAIFMLLCYYFSNDNMFLDYAANLGLKNPSLEKGILLAGGIGVGKTSLMHLFSKNQRQVFAIRTAKSIADTFQSDGEGILQQLIECPKLPINDAQNFYHPKMALCIDDIGTEELKNHYGNRKNVVGDLIELRYSKQNTGLLLHMTTNLTMQQVKDFYGDRVGSRLRETMNIIEMKGDDRRK